METTPADKHRAVDRAVASIERLQSIEQSASAQHLDFSLNQLEILLEAMGSEENVRAVTNQLRKDIPKEQRPFLDENAKKLAELNKELLLPFVRRLRSPWLEMLCFMASLAPYGMYEQLFDHMREFLKTQGQDWAETFTPKNRKNNP